MALAFTALLLALLCALCDLCGYHSFMGYRNLRECIDDLGTTRPSRAHRRRGRCAPRSRRDSAPRLRRGGPALLFTRVKGCRFPMASNLFGTIDRARFMFRDTLERVRRLVELKIDPTAGFRRPLRYASAPLSALATLPKFVSRGRCDGQRNHDLAIAAAGELAGATAARSSRCRRCIRKMSTQPGWRHSNLGMYRVQLSGGQYEPDREIGLHYQIQRSIGVHHAAAIQRGQAVSRECVRRRPARDDARRRDAAARRDERADVRRCARRAIAFRMLRSR